MAPDRNDSSSSKSRPAVPSIPGVEIIATASRRLVVDYAAAQRTPVGRRVYYVIRNLTLVVPLTVLVWLYAERETIQPDQVVVPVMVRAERADRIAELATSADRVLSIKVSGTRARIQQVRDELAKTQGLEIVAPAQLELGPQVALPAMEAVNANPIFLQRGITVTSLHAQYADPAG